MGNGDYNLNSRANGIVLTVRLRSKRADRLTSRNGRNSVHGASRVTLVRVYAGHAAS